VRSSQEKLRGWHEYAMSGCSYTGLWLSCQRHRVHLPTPRCGRRPSARGNWLRHRVVARGDTASPHAHPTPLLLPARAAVATAAQGTQYLILGPFHRSHISEICSYRYQRGIHPTFCGLPSALPHTSILLSYSNDRPQSQVQLWLAPWHRICKRASQQAKASTHASSC
jgi:hypothetical protein